MENNELFRSGNYNEWVKLINESIPKINKSIKSELVPSIDNTLISMLGYQAIFSKDKINISQIFKDNLIIGIYCDITYFVDDFKIPNAPREAVQTDTEAIKKAVSKNNMEIKEIDIDTSTGYLHIQFEILFDNSEKEETEV